MGIIAALKLTLHAPRTLLMSRPIYTTLSKPETVLQESLSTLIWTFSAEDVDASRDFNEMFISI